MGPVDVEMFAMAVATSLTAFNISSSPSSTLESFLKFKFVPYSLTLISLSPSHLSLPPMSLIPMYLLSFNSLPLCLSHLISNPSNLSSFPSFSSPSPFLIFHFPLSLLSTSLSSSIVENVYYVIDLLIIIDMIIQHPATRCSALAFTKVQRCKIK